MGKWIRMVWFHRDGQRAGLCLPVVNLLNILQTHPKKRLGQSWWMHAQSNKRHVLTLRMLVLNDSYAWWWSWSWHIIAVTTMTFSWWWQTMMIPIFNTLQTNPSMVNVICFTFHGFSMRISSWLLHLLRRRPHRGFSISFLLFESPFTSTSRVQLQLKLDKTKNKEFLDGFGNLVTTFQECCDSWLWTCNVISCAPPKLKAGSLERGCARCSSSAGQNDQDPDGYYKVVPPQLCLLVYKSH